MATPDRKVDFELLDRFQSFGAEIVRLALLAPSALGFFIALGGPKPEMAGVRAILHQVELPLGRSLTCFALAVGCGLAHRYLSSDTMVVLIERDRAFERNDPAKARELTGQIHRRLRLAAPVLALGAIFLAVGVAFLLRAFYMGIGPDLPVCSCCGYRPPCGH